MRRVPVIVAIVAVLAIASLASAAEKKDSQAGPLGQKSTPGFASWIKAGPGTTSSGTTRLYEKSGSYSGRSETHGDTTRSYDKTGSYSGRRQVTSRVIRLNLVAVGLPRSMSDG